MLRLITVAIAVLAMASAALGQDEFNVNTNPGSTVPANCNPAYDAAMEKLNEQDAQAEGQLRKDIVNCQGQYGDNHQACIDAANKKFSAVHIEVLKGQIDAEASRSICDNRVHLAAAAAFNARNKPPDPCHSQYDQTMNSLSDQETLSEAQLRKDTLDCQSQSGQTQSDGSCRDAATQKFGAAHNKILNGQTDAETNRTICEDRKALAQRGTQVPANFWRG